MLAAGVGVALLHGCGDSDSSGTSSSSAMGSTYNPIAAVPVGAEFKIAGAGQLEKDSALAFVLPDQSHGIVFVTQSGELRALSSKCTHMGGIVEWQGNDLLRCPSHGSRFNANGKVLNGPATKPLKIFKARKDGGDALITTA